MPLTVAACLIVVLAAVYIRFTYKIIRVNLSSNGTGVSADPISPVTRGCEYIILRLAIILISLIIMLCFAGRVSLWLDDIATIEFVSEHRTISENITSVLNDANHPPLFYIIAWLWLRIAPYGTMWIKLPNIIMCCVGMWFCGSAAKKIGGEGASVIATAISSASVYLIKNAAYNFRDYALIFMLVAIFINVYIYRLQNPKKLSAYIVFGAVLTLILYAHNFGVPVLCVFVVCDLILILRGKVQVRALLPYLAAAAAAAVWYVIVFPYLSHSLTSFWAQPPKFIDLIKVIVLMSNGLWLDALAFAGVTITVFFFIRRAEKLVGGINDCSAYTLRLCGACAVGVPLLAFVYSRYLNSSASVFVLRYFLSVFPCFIVSASVGYAWFVRIVAKAAKTATAGFVAVLMLVFANFIYIPNMGYMLYSLYEFAGVIDEPYEQTIDYIYSQPDAHSDGTLVVGSAFLGGYYYYATHHGERENLNIGTLDGTNWVNYDTVYAMPIHEPINAAQQAVLDEHFVPVDYGDGLPVIKYKRK